MVEISQLEHFANAVETTVLEPTWRWGVNGSMEDHRSEVRLRIGDAHVMDL